MMTECRCGKCNRLLARAGEYTELQIKCSRCATMNHLRATSPALTPQSVDRAARLPSNPTQHEASNHG
ncbi:Com family DNA-binding transcriptional regulator [Pseudomonas phoenicis]|uniref:Com family DNA-binding transcriptional regulator n=1 Tax=unclassified Pseudomonas TaxID=196821 RepID=UPI0039A2A0A7